VGRARPVITLNGEPSAHRDESVADLVARLGVGPAGVAVALDGEILARSQWAQTRVADGSHVEVVTAMAGG
jgi:sulfur carrier protein